ncbi:MAG TPA: cbb3-type cytochrome c oxidase N-terminal domain-containing protein [Saprospiraceae bacterium]|nr:cbb3-type cytochrome c oxidase N-terminal domain-containing protein [Saprospiraceae bacterium]
MKSNKFLFTFILLADTLTGWSQAAQATTPAATGGADQQLPDIMAMILAIAGAALFIVAMIYVIKVNQFLYKRVVSLEAQKSGATLPAGVSGTEAPAGDSFWTQMRKKYWEDAVPIERENEIILHEAHDGIRELDNRLPPWWVNMFILTIVWAVGYMYYYHWGGNGLSSAEEYKTEVEAAKKQIATALAGKANAVDESNVTVVTDAGALGEGELIFKNTCAACHGQKGEGTVGPNFTDEYWIHGGGIKDLFKTIKYGVPEKGMISWQAQLKPADIQKVASYILTLQGTNPPNPKAPQGTLWKPETQQDSIPTQQAEMPGSK